MVVFGMLMTLLLSAVACWFVFVGEPWLAVAALSIAVGFLIAALRTARRELRLLDGPTR